ncbi:hypothetical protein GGX14DRAFT_632240 [Mycena pura]|uniref:Uncharacterized protein n=1 Tax=Mycena pura TaxID=153505 RepID=A0AAD6VGH2_9AGAR|nr:hypothetical protein GGX14DRAFT_632240 [Mycena pura]
MRDYTEEQAFVVRALALLLARTSESFLPSSGLGNTKAEAFQWGPCAPPPPHRLSPSANSRSPTPPPPGPVSSSAARPRSRCLPTHALPAPAGALARLADAHKLKCRASVLFRRSFTSPSVRPQPRSPEYPGPPSSDLHAVQHECKSPIHGVCLCCAPPAPASTSKLAAARDATAAVNAGMVYPRSCMGSVWMRIRTECAAHAAMHARADSFMSHLAAVAWGEQSLAKMRTRNAAQIQMVRIVSISKLPSRTRFSSEGQNLDHGPRPAAYLRSMSSP